MKKICLFLIVIIIQSSRGFAQAPYYIFDQDSLKGFDEEAARKTALSEQFFGAEFKIKMYRLKREFINNKYGLKKNVSNNTSYFTEAARPAVVPACTNEDFEASPAGVVTGSTQVLGWTVAGGYNGYVDSQSPAYLQAAFPGGLNNAGSCNLLGCCPLPPEAEIIDCAPGGYIDQNIGPQYPVFSVFGTGSLIGSGAVNPHITGGLFGTKVIRLNNMFTADYSIAKLSKTFFVTPSNALFRFAFISVVSPGHNCCDAGAIQIRLLNSSVQPATVIACPSYSFAVPDIVCTNSVNFTFYNPFSGTTYTPGATFGHVYNQWNLNSVDLSAYLGQNITVEAIASDCNAGGHFGYLYFDAQCGPMNLRINQNDFSIANSVHEVVCGTSASMTAPANLGPYQWSGPGGFSANSPSVNVSVSGVYTLTFGQTAFCAAVTKTLNLIFSNPTGTISSSSPVLCAGDPAILTALGMNNCTWSDGNTTLSIFVSPTVTTTYSVSGTSQDGCPVTAMITQTVDNCTGLKTLKNSNADVFVYPNPNRGEFVMSLEKELRDATLRIENTLGQVVHAQALRHGANLVRTKDLPAGVYYYTVLENGNPVLKGKFKIE